MRNTPPFPVYVFQVKSSSENEAYLYNSDFYIFNYHSKDGRVKKILLTGNYIELKVSNNKVLS